MSQYIVIIRKGRREFTKKISAKNKKEAINKARKIYPESEIVFAYTYY